MIAHDRTGSGEPYVLIHGIGSRRGVWDPVVPALAREFEVVAVDLPGFGDSPRGDATAWSPPAQAQRVADWLAAEGIEQPHVAGNSMGGGIALELARLGAARTVTALSPIGFWSPREHAYGRRSIRTSLRLSRLLAPAAPTLAATGAGRALLVSQMRARPWRASGPDIAADVRGLAGATAVEDCLAAMENWRVERAEELRGTPLTIAWGDKDRLLLYRRQSERARRLLPWARHVTLTGCGHLPFADDPEQVAAVLAAGTRAPAA